MSGRGYSLSYVCEWHFEYSSQGLSAPCGLQEPVPGVVAHPFPSNLLEWHFVLEGGKGTEYEGGVYHGVMTFPPAYPYRPPSLQMLTPSGRFAVGQKICLSNTDFHAETWCASACAGRCHMQRS